MLLNPFGQPTVITRENRQLNIDELQDFPLLLCHKNALLHKLLPKNYVGCLYASDTILDDFKQKNYLMNQYSKRVLVPNETIEISCNEAVNKSLGLDHRFKLTMIPFDEENVSYLIKAANDVTSLITDNLSEHLDAFICNKMLRHSVNTGIDVLYINDGVYCKSPQLTIYPTECLLLALTELVQPRYVFGISGKDLSEFYLDHCQPVDTT